MFSRLSVDDIDKGDGADQEKEDKDNKHTTHGRGFVFSPVMFKGERAKVCERGKHWARGWAGVKSYI